MIPRTVSTACCLLLLTASLATAADYNGYLTVNDEDYGYWEARVTIFPGGEAVTLDEHSGPIEGTLVFEVGHDLAQGLVRQNTPRVETEAPGAMSISSVDEAAMATGGRDQAPPRGDGSWVFVKEFASFGFGQYEGSETTAHVYCSDGPKVWAWLAGPVVEGSTPDDVANQLIMGDNQLARLKMGCDKPLVVEHE